MSDFKTIDSLLYAALEELKTLLPKRDYVNSKDSIDAGEPELGLETICSQLYEFQIRFPETAHRLLAKAGDLLKMRPAIWQKLLPFTREL